MVVKSDIPKNLEHYGKLAYTIILPAGITSSFAKRCYWELMNEVRTEPYVRRFEVTKWLKLRY